MSNQLDTILENISSVLLTRNNSGGAFVDELLRDYSELCGDDLDVTVFGYPTIDSFLKSFPEKFVLVNNKWRGIGTEKTFHILASMATERNKKKSLPQSNKKVRKSHPGSHQMSRPLRSWIPKSNSSNGPSPTRTWINHNNLNEVNDLKTFNQLQTINENIPNIPNIGIPNQYNYPGDGEHIEMTADKPKMLCFENSNRRDRGHVYTSENQYDEGFQKVEVFLGNGETISEGPPPGLPIPTLNVKLPHLKEDINVKKISSNTIPVLNDLPIPILAYNTSKENGENEQIEHMENLESDEIRIALEVCKILNKCNSKTMRELSEQIEISERELGALRPTAKIATVLLKLTNWFCMKKNKDEWIVSLRQIGSNSSGDLPCSSDILRPLLNIPKSSIELAPSSTCIKSNVKLGDSRPSTSTKVSQRKPPEEPYSYVKMHPYLTNIIQGLPLLEKVRLTYFTNFHKFYLRCTADEGIYKRLKNELKYDYERVEKRKIRWCPGDAACVCYEGQWHRSVVINTDHNQMVKLFFIDEGFTACVNPINLIPLHEYYNTPPLAFCCTVQPYVINPGKREYFLDKYDLTLKSIRTSVLDMKPIRILSEQFIEVQLIYHGSLNDVVIPKIFSDMGIVSLL